MANEFSITVSMDVFKQLTARLEQGQTHDDVIRDLLAMDSIVELEQVLHPSVAALKDQFDHMKLQSVLGRDGFYSRGLWLPNGSLMKARYQQREFRAEIKNNCWFDENGNSHSSPSAAASAITGNNVNGLRFWEAKRPTDKGWVRLANLVQS